MTDIQKLPKAKQGNSFTSIKAIDFSFYMASPKKWRERISNNHE